MLAVPDALDAAAASPARFHGYEHMSETTSPRRAYTAAEAASILNIGRTWLLEKAVDKTEGPLMGAYRTNGDSGHWRFDPDAFDRYVADLRSGRIVARRARPIKRRKLARRPRNVQMAEWLESFKREKVG